MRISNPPVREPVHLPALRNMHLPGKLHQLPDPVGGHRAVQKRRDNGNHAAEGGGEVAPLLQKQGHGSVGDIPGPQPEQAVAEGRELNHCAQNGHKDIRLNGEQIVFQADILEFLLPPAHLFAVVGSHAKGFDGVKNCRWSPTSKVIRLLLISRTFLL